MPREAISLLQRRLWKLQFPQESVRKAEILSSLQTEWSHLGRQSEVFNCPGGSGQLVTLDSLPHHASACGSHVQLLLSVTMDCVGSNSRLWETIAITWGVLLTPWRPHLFSQTHGFQPSWVWGLDLVEAGSAHCDLGESLTPAQGEGIGFFVVTKWPLRAGFLGAGSDFSARSMNTFWKKMSQHFEDDESH